MSEIINVYSSSSPFSYPPLSVLSSSAMSAYVVVLRVLAGALISGPQTVCRVVPSPVLIYVLFPPCSALGSIGISLNVSCSCLVAAIN